MLDPDRVNGYFERGVIEVAPLAFMRGRTLNDSFVILDEAQNTSPEQMKMFLTRLGFNSRMVVTGDSHPDRPARPTSAPASSSSRTSSRGQDISFVRFGGEDVVRHKLVQRIVAAYGDARRRERAARPNTGRPRVLSLDLDDVPGELRGPVGAPLDAPGVGDGTWRSRSSPSGSASSTRARGRDEPTDVLAFRSTAGPTPGRASSATSRSAPSTAPT
jgi:hypothetical protein